MYLQTPGKKPLVWLKVIETVPSASESLNHIPAALFSLQSLSMSVKLLLLSLCNSFSSYRAPAVQVCTQWCSCMAGASDPASFTLDFKLSFSPRLALTPHAGIPPPPPALGERSYRG